MKCDVILPVCDQYDYAKGCIESMIAKTRTPYRIIVINNGKDARIKEYLEGLIRAGRCEIDVVSNAQNMGWVWAINKGIEMSRAPYVCFQNDDTVVTEDWLGKMIRIAEGDSRIGIVNPRWEGKRPSESIDDFAKEIERSPRGYIETDWARGFCVVVKREVLDKIGGLDDIYSPAYFDDVDFSVRAIEAGFLCVQALHTYVHHYRNKTFFEVLRGPRWNEVHERNKLIYFRRWGKPLRVALILKNGVFAHKACLDDIENLVFYLARKQHRVYVYSPRNIDGRFLHTNIITKVFPGVLFPILTFLEIQKANMSKKEAKRYAGVFCLSGQGDDLNAVRAGVDRIKDETRKDI